MSTEHSVEHRSASEAKPNECNTQSIVSMADVTGNGIVRSRLSVMVELIEFARLYNIRFTQVDDNTIDMSWE